MGDKLNMFLASNNEKKFFYKISDIKTGTTAKGSPYAFISISNKKKDGEYENGKLMFWDKIENVEKNDLVAFSNVIGAEYYSFQPTGSLKTYVGVNISVSTIEIKKAQKTEETATPEQKTPEQATPVQPQPTPTPSDKLQPIKDESIPF